MSTGICTGPWLCHECISDRSRSITSLPSPPTPTYREVGESGGDGGGLVATVLAVPLLVLSAAAAAPLVLWRVQDDATLHAAAAAELWIKTPALRLGSAPTGGHRTAPLTSSTHRSCRSSQTPCSGESSTSSESHAPPLAGGRFEARSGGSCRCGGNRRAAAAAAPAVGSNCDGSFISGCTASGALPGMLKTARTGSKTIAMLAIYGAAGRLWGPRSAAVAAFITKEDSKAEAVGNRSHSSAGFEFVQSEQKQRAAIMIRTRPSVQDRTQCPACAAAKRPAKRQRYLACRPVIAADACLQSILDLPAPRAPLLLLFI